MYIACLVIPVPETQLDAYLDWARNSAAFFQEYGCLEIMEAREDLIPEGKNTDFRKAVKAEPGEKIVLQWQIWPDKAMFEEAEHKMHDDPRMDSAGQPPFDASRLILGMFSPLYVMGRD